MKRLLPLFFVVCLTFGPILFFHSCANTTEAPTGGKKDTIPPYITEITPLPGVVGVPVSGAKFTFTFNEYVSIKNKQNIRLSPPQKKPLEVKLKGKSVIVTFEEPLDSGRTYTISFSDAIVDNNENNVFAGYTYAFSTGDRIDSMMVTGTVLDCNTLKPVKGATVLLHTDLADSASMLHLPYASTMTDDWGFFSIPFIKDTTYRLYAVSEETVNYIYDPDADRIAFVDSLIRPEMHASDTARELLRYDMLDTLNCLARRSEHNLRLFKEKSSKQLIVKRERTSERSAYITFQAPDAWIDSMWIKGVPANRLITQFNVLQDSLEIWINSRNAAPDTMHLFVNYRKTDSLGILKPELEHLRIPLPDDKRTYTKRIRKNIQHKDTTCVFNVTAKPETVEQDGFVIQFTNPIINEDFSGIAFRSINPRQQETIEKFNVERDSLDIKKYVIRPEVKLLQGYDYYLDIPHHAFRDINGFWSDSLEVKVALPTDEKLSTLSTVLTGVDRKIIVELLDGKGTGLRKYTIDSDRTLSFPYLPQGTYSIRITDDGNRNSIVDTGSLLDHRQPEMVAYVQKDGGRFIVIPPYSEVVQNIDIQKIFSE